MERRQSLALHGAEEDDVEALREFDESFYGFESAAAEAARSSSASDSEADSDREPLEKRVDYGSSDDEVYSDDAAVPLEQAPEEIEQALIGSQIRDNVSRGCGCEGYRHWEDLPEDELVSFMFKLRRLKKHDLKQLVLGELTACAHQSESASHKKYYFTYTVLGKRVCRDVFKEVHGIGRHILRSLQEAVEAQDVTPPTHAGRGRAVTHALAPDTVQAVKLFIKSYASVWGMPQPAAPRGRAQVAPIYLPASSKKKDVFKLYSETEGATPMAYSTFVKTWNEQCSEVVVMKPRTDVCAWCEKLREATRKARTEEKIGEATGGLTQHLMQAGKERQYYKAKIEQANGHAQEQDPTMVHITFDFAQQLELPQHTRQVGPIYFKSRFKVQLFGVCNEAAKKQTNFLFHEGESIGSDGKKAHGPNSVISMVHHYLRKQCSSAKIISMHADNCVGQNKNKSVMAFICWYVMHGYAEEVIISFMRVGHTRCSVDAKFGRLKQQFRNSEVDSMDDVVSAVDSSCAANDALRYSWLWRVWDSFLADFFSPIRGIRNYQHFRATKAKPGVLFVKETCEDADEKEIALLRPSKTVANVKAAGLPAVLPAAGISEERLHYLEAQIKPFLSQDKLPPWSAAPEQEGD